MEAELLASDSERVIGDVDHVEAENQLNMYRCARCQADFGPDVGGVCMVDQTQAYCITCKYWKLTWLASCPSGKHYKLESENAA